MRLRTYPNTPLWFDLLLAIGVIALAHGLDHVIYPSRQPFRFDEAFPPKDPESQYPPEDRESQSRDDYLNLGKGAVGNRPSQEPYSRQQTRAEEMGRGRSAASPIAIPASGWKDIFWRTYRQIGDDRLLAVAAGVVFYMLLALFPAITALVSLYGILTNPATINDHLLLLQGVIPGGPSGSSKSRSLASPRRVTPRSALGSFLGSRWLCGARMPG
jgi:hypothetical protein